MDDKFKLPGNIKNELSEIFTPEYLPAVEKACCRYLIEANKQVAPRPEQYRNFSEISAKASELNVLLKTHKALLKKLEFKSNLSGGSMTLFKIKKNLAALSNAADQAAAIVKPLGRGRPSRSYDKAARSFCYQLVCIYKSAHGCLPSRTVNNYLERETGPMTRATEILRPTLKLKSNFSIYFREILEDHKRMDF